MCEIAFEDILKSCLVFNEAKMFILTENTIFGAVAKVNIKFPQVFELAEVPPCQSFFPLARHGT